LRAGVLRHAWVLGALALMAAYALAAVFALPVRADTLEQALGLAYQNNPQLNSQRAVVRATDETVPQALSGYKPTIRATGTIGQEYTSTVAKTGSSKGVTVSTPTGTTTINTPSSAPIYPRTAFGYSPNSVSATVTQTLYNGLQTANSVRLAEANTSAARETLRVTEQTILLNGATAYMDLLRDGALLEVQRRNVEVLQEQLRQTRDRFIVGEVTRTDVAQAEASLAQGRAAVLTAESNYARSRATYRQVIGVEAANLVPAAPVDRLSPSRLNDAIGLGRARHPNVGVAMFGIDAAVLQVKINEGTLYPTAQLVGTVNNNWEQNLTSQLQNFNAFVQGQITVPLYQGEEIASP
jgi:outer membrane protein